MSWRTGRRWLITAAIVVVPFGGVAFLLYEAGRLAIRTRRALASDRHDELVTLWDLVGWRGTKPEVYPGPRWRA